MLQYMKNNGSASLISKLEILSYLSPYYCLVRRVNVISTLYSFIEEFYGMSRDLA